MPQEFDACVKAGGRVRTVTGPNKKFGLSDGEYVHVCFKNGKMIKGYVKSKGGGAERTKAAHKAIDGKK